MRCPTDAEQLTLGALQAWRLFLLWAARPRHLRALVQPIHPPSVRPGFVSRGHVDWRRRVAGGRKQNGGRRHNDGAQSENREEGARGHAASLQGRPLLCQRLWACFSAQILNRGATAHGLTMGSTPAALSATLAPTPSPAAKAARIASAVRFQVS